MNHSSISRAGQVQQLTLFDFPSVQDAIPQSPIPKFQKIYRSWRGEIEVTCSWLKRSKPEFLFAINIYEPTGEWVHMVEVIGDLLKAEEEFRDIVDQFVNSLFLHANSDGVDESFNTPSLFAPEHSSNVLEQISFDTTTAPEQRNYVLEQVKPDTAPEHSSHVLEQPISDTAPEQSDSVLEQVTPGAPEHLSTNVISSIVPEHNHWIETYSPSKRKNHSYYRYCWMDGRKINHVHISGGNIHSVTANYRRALVGQAIANGKTPTEIKQLVSSWSSQSQ